MKKVRTDFKQDASPEYESLDEIPEHSMESVSSNDLKISELLDDPQFHTNLETITRRVFVKFGPSERYQTSEDLQQDVLLMVMKCLPEHKDETSFKKVLHIIARNLYIDAKRAERRGAQPHRKMPDRSLASAAETAEDKLEQMLLEVGLLSEIPPRITDFTPYEKRKPIKVKGKPISETIIEERR